MAGSNIHWSRLVDLPIAGLKLLFTPLFGGKTAETIAVTVAPLLPMLVAMLGDGADHPAAGLALRLSARHRLPRLRRLGGRHVAAAADRPSWLAARLPRLDRGGADRSEAAARPASRSASPPPCRWSSASKCCSISPPPGAIVVLIWIRDGEPQRLFAYGVTLAGGCAFGFLVFASEANRLPMCDALSPVWLSAMVAAGAVAMLLAWRVAAAPGSDGSALAALGGVADRRRLRAGLAALPRPARAELARARAALALQGARGDADLAAWLGHGDPDRHPAASPA